MAYRFDRKQFFNGYRQKFGRLTQEQVDGLNFLLGQIEADEEWPDERHIAYTLATTKHETAHTFQPIREFGEGEGKDYGETYYGRGYVQITWKENYRKLSEVIGVDLVAEPDLALDPRNAYLILAKGMRDGLFTGKKLSDYINERTDYFGARAIVNGTDKAKQLASMAVSFAQILRGSLIHEPTFPVPTPQPPPVEPPPVVPAPPVITPPVVVPPVVSPVPPQPAPSFPTLETVKPAEIGTIAGARAYVYVAAGLPYALLAWAVATGRAVAFIAGLSMICVTGIAIALIHKLPITEK